MHFASIPGEHTGILSQGEADVILRKSIERQVWLPGLQCLLSHFSDLYFLLLVWFRFR